MKKRNYELAEASSDGCSRYIYAETTARRGAIEAMSRNRFALFEAACFVELRPLRGKIEIKTKASTRLKLDAWELLDVWDKISVPHRITEILYTYKDNSKQTTKTAYPRN